MSKTPSDLGKDTRGAILMLGIVMGALLVGALWHIASIGDAIAWRERAQDAADAAAYENAVWHARGMNVIAAINIVMSLVLAVLVVWRTLLILLTVALVIATVLCVVTFGTGCGFTAAVARWEASMLRHDNAVATNVVRILSGMSAAEIAVATSTPVVGLIQASLNTSGSYDVTQANTQSASLLPSVNLKGLETIARCLKGVKAGKMPDKNAPDVLKNYQDFLNNPRMGIGVSLPVQYEQYNVLCMKAGESLWNNLAGFLERSGAPGGVVQGVDKAKTFLGAITGSLPGLFCAPTAAGEDPAAGLADKIGSQAVDSCKSEVQDKRQFVDNGGELEVMYRDDAGKLVTEDEYIKDCVKKKKKDADKQLKGAFTTDSSSYDLTECGAPAKVWEWAVNGNVMMRSFAQVERDTPMLERDDRGLEIADRGQTGNVEQVTPEQVTAHAEMYFDCPGRWMGCRSNAMWSLRWRARLRRVQPMDKLAATGIEPAMVATITRAFEGVASRAGDAVVDRAHIPKIVVPKIKDTWYFRNAKAQLQKAMYSSGAFEGIGAYVIRNSSGDGLIH